MGDRARRAMRIVPFGLLLALVTGASGCLASTMVPPMPPPVRLSAPTEFALYGIDSDTRELRADCLVRRIEGTVLAVRADTLLLGEVKVLRRARGAPACIPADTFRVVTSQNWLVQSERVSVHAKRTVRTDRFRATTPPIRLVAAAGFPLRTSATRGVPEGVACTVQDVEGVLAAMHGDTLFLTQLRVHRRAGASPECPALHTAFVVVSEQPQLQARVDRASGMHRFFEGGMALAFVVATGFMLYATVRIGLLLY